jgi:hypothetical protein
MKTLFSATAVAALVAFSAASFSFVTNVSLFFTAGFIALTVADYRRVLRPLALGATAGATARVRRERLGLAA